MPTGEPEPRIEWSKLRAPLPWQHRVVNGTLVIPRAAQQDSGQYICNASSPAGFTEVFVTLDVESKGLWLVQCGSTSITHLPFAALPPSVHPFQICSCPSPSLLTLLSHVVSSSLVHLSIRCLLQLFMDTFIHPFPLDVSIALSISALIISPSVLTLLSTHCSQIHLFLSHPSIHPCIQLLLLLLALLRPSTTREAVLTHPSWHSATCTSISAHIHLSLVDPSFNSHLHSSLSFAAY